MTAENAAEIFRQRFIGNFNAHVGLQLDEVRPGYSRLRLPIRPEVLQPTGIVHGGAVATLADVAGGVAAHTTHPRGSRLVTVEMKINFIGAVRAGELIAEADALHVGRRTSVWRVNITDGKGKQIAYSIATYMVVEAPPQD
ncbi:MAG: PaaI family thioesterase [bacterium]|nr:PaaI family thioesterase [bacterium]